MKKLTTLNVLLIERNQEKSELLAMALRSNEYLVTQICASGISLLREVERNAPDLIVMDVESPDRDTIQSLSLVTQMAPRPIIMFSEQESGETINSIVASGVTTYVVGEVAGQRIKSIVDTALARFDNYQQLKHELATTQHKLSAEKEINRAKAWLMENKHISEKEAHARLRKTAMDSGKKIEEVARNLLAVVSLMD